MYDKEIGAVVKKHLNNTNEIKDVSAVTEDIANTANTLSNKM
jgi:hypothetical protein